MLTEDLPPRGSEIESLLPVGPESDPSDVFVFRSCLGRSLARTSCMST